MRYKLGRLVCLLFVATLVISSISLAGGTSSATIDKTQDGAWGAYYSLSASSGWSTSYTYVKNDSSSKITLWAAGNSSTGKEFLNASAAPGKWGGKDGSDIAAGKYRVVLDPSGPLAKGCKGSGYFDFWE